MEDSAADLAVGYYVWVLSFVLLLLAAHPALSAAAAAERVDRTDVRALACSPPVRSAIDCARRPRPDRGGRGRRAAPRQRWHKRSIDGPVMSV